MQNPSQDFGEVYFALCKSVNTPHALACWLGWKYKSFTSVSKPEPRHYDTARTFSFDYLVYSWASKAQVNLEDKDLALVALEGFKADEFHNTKTSQRIRSWSSYGEHSAGVEPLIFRLQRKIAQIIGPLNVKKVLEKCRLGNGASASLSRVQARYDKKITTFPFSVSPQALPYGRAVMEADPAWVRCFIPDYHGEGPVSLLPVCFNVLDYNVFDTVPKSLKTDRTIAKEPTINGFLQQGVHVYLRQRLKHFGVDLRDQTVNQHMAASAHLLGWATLDAESASNSVTTALVKLLLPADWFEFLDSLRSHHTLLPDGTLHKNAMFSSMGNAFTFELESMIFYAILAVTCEGSEKLVSVYGDDMIVPQEYAGRCIENLELLGFRINRGKSFISGRFFESCGMHAFDGYDVTPAYQKEPMNLASACIRAHNRLVRWALRQGGGVLDPVVKNACELLVRRGHLLYVAEQEQLLAQCLRTPDRPCLTKAEFESVQKNLRGFRRGDLTLTGPLGPETDTWFQVPYGNYVVRGGNALHYELRPKVKTRKTIQRAAYAYWLRLRSQTDEHIVDEARLERRYSPTSAQAMTCHRAYLRKVSEPLVLSEVTNDDVVLLKKKRTALSAVDVDATWFNN